MNVNTPEFVQAWNEASQALLRLVQVAYSEGDNVGAQKIVSSIMSTTTLPVDDTIVQSAVVSVAQSVVHRAKVSELYTNSPISMGDGSYIFKRLQDDPEGRFYKITTYDDGNCEFELLTNIDDDHLQDLVANKSTILASAVARVKGDIKEKVKISITKPGKAVSEGRIVRIIEPMEVTFS